MWRKTGENQRVGDGVVGEGRPRDLLGSFARPLSAVDYIVCPRSAWLPSTYFIYCDSTAIRHTDTMAPIQQKALINVDLGEAVRPLPLVKRQKTNATEKSTATGRAAPTSSSSP